MTVILRRFLISLAICLLAPPRLYPQASTEARYNRFTRNFLVRLDYYRGKIVKVFPTQPTTSASSYYSCNFLWQTDGSRDWHSRFNYPEVGLNILYANLGNDSVIGSSIGAFPNMILKLRGERSWGFYFKFGTGFAWFSKRYDRITNPQDNVIGSHLVNITAMGCNAFVSISPHFDLHGGYSIIHYSNGHVNIPNVGSNDFPWNFGVKYKPAKSVINRTHLPDTSRKPIVFNIRLGLGFHEMSGTVNPNSGPLYPIYVIAPYLSKNFNHKGKIRLGVCAMYYTSFYDFIKSEEYYKGEERRHAWVVSITAGHEYLMGHTSFMFEPSFNIYNPLFNDIIFKDMSNTGSFFVQMKKWMAIRTGLMYYTLDKAKYPRYNPAVGLFIKTNRDQADYVEFSISSGL